MGHKWWEMCRKHKDASYSYLHASKIFRYYFPKSRFLIFQFENLRYVNQYKNIHASCIWQYWLFSDGLHLNYPIIA